MHQAIEKRTHRLPLGASLHSKVRYSRAVPDFVAVVVDFALNAAQREAPRGARRSPVFQHQLGVETVPLDQVSRMPASPLLYLGKDRRHVPLWVSSIRVFIFKEVSEVGHAVGRKRVNGL